MAGGGLDLGPSEGEREEGFFELRLFGLLVVMVLHSCFFFNSQAIVFRLSEISR